MPDLKSLKEFIELVTEEDLLTNDEPTQDDNEVDEMTTCGSIGAMGYQAPLGLDPTSPTAKSKRKSKK